MKVVILTEGGENIGFGHITRCVALCEAFEEKGIKPLLVVNGDRSIPGLLRNRKKEIFNWLEEKNRLFSLLKNTDIAIIDSYLASAKFYKIISDMVKTAIYVDDYKRLNYPKGIVLNFSLNAGKIRYPKLKGVSYLLGTRYTVLRREFWNAPEKYIENKIKNIVITFGGSDRSGMTGKVLRILNKDYPELRKIVVVGQGFSSKHIGQIRKMKDKMTELAFYPSATKMKEAMIKSDVAISAGGQTLYELARMGVPTIAVCIANNQSGNIRGMKKRGFLKHISPGGNGIAKSLTCGLTYLENRKRRKKMSESGRNIIDGEGRKRILSEVL